MSASSNRQTLWLGAVIVFLAMAALGWTLGRQSGTPPATAPPDSAGNAAKSAIAKAHARATKARGRVSAIRRGGNPDQRMRATIELANTISPSQFAEWMDGGWFDFRSGFELTLFRRILEERWRAEDPEGFVAWCLEEGEQGPDWATSKPRGAALPLLTDWALTNPERLRSFFNRYPDDALEAQLISKLAKKHPELAIARLKEMLGRGANGYQLQSALGQLAKFSPDGVTAILEDLPASLRLQAESALIKTRLESSFGETIGELYQRPDGWKLFSNSMHNIKGVGEKLLEELPNLPPAWRNALARDSLFSLMYNGDAQPWLEADLEGAGFTAEQVTRIRSTAFSALASRKPEAALQLLADSGFDEAAQRNMISNIFRNAGRDAGRAESMMALLASEEHREAARAAIAQISADQPSPQRQSYDSPEDWLAAATAEDFNSRNGSQLTYALRQWNAEQVSELTRQFHELPAEQKDQVAEVVLRGSDYTSSNVTPELAGEVILHLLTADGDAAEESERSSRASRMASSNAVRWVQQDANAASDWVRSLSEGDAKRWAQLNLGATWAQYDPPAMEQWLGTLPADTQSEVREFINGQHPE